MRCPTLKELPLPSPDKTGWPWTEESPRLPDEMPDGAPWPRISIVTPSFNQSGFIEETIRSVLLQGYPNLEYMIFDGGSKDGSVEVIEKYSPWLAHWTSEPDRGQAHAINKGFSRSTGSLLAWINSDDYYLPDVLRLFAKSHLSRPIAILMGDVENFADGTDEFWLTEQFNVSFKNIVHPENEPWSWHQPGLFVPKILNVEVGPLDETLRYTFDLDWLLRLLKTAEVYYLHRTVARFRVHNAAKTTADYPAWVKEGHQLLQKKYWPMFPGINRVKGESLYYFRMAQIYLGYQPKHAMYWNRLATVRYLMAAFWQYPKVIFRSDFLKICRRLMLPKCLLRSNPFQSKSHHCQD